MAYSVKRNNIFKGYDKNATLEFVLPDVAPSPQTRKPGIENAVYNDSSTESDQIWLQINFISQKKKKKTDLNFFFYKFRLLLYCSKKPFIPFTHCLIWLFDKKNYFVQLKPLYILVNFLINSFQNFRFFFYKFSQNQD